MLHLTQITQKESIFVSSLRKFLLVHFTTNMGNKVGKSRQDNELDKSVGNINLDKAVKDSELDKSVEDSELDKSAGNSNLDKAVKDLQTNKIQELGLDCKNYLEK
jgi:hypothetical protein